MANTIEEGLSTEDVGNMHVYERAFEGMSVYAEAANKTSALRASTREGGSTNDVDTRVLVLVDRPLPGWLRSMARLDHAISGICSEAGELAEHLKHVRFAGKELDRQLIVKELGDVLWYVAEACVAIGVSMAYVAARNLLKLSRRYPEGFFTVARSENRTPENE